MSELVRLFRYRELLAGSRRAWRQQDLCQALEISPATFKRDLAKLRDQLHQPVRFDRERRGYIWDAQSPNTELPGLWFSPQEVLALVTIQQLLQQLAPGILGPKLQPLRARLEQLMQANGLAQEDIARRIRLVQPGARTPQPQHFEAVAAATVARRRLRVQHFHRLRGEVTERELSPQRLVHDRGNWYVDAWCHTRQALRSFALDALREARVLDEHPSDEIPAEQLDAVLGAGFGIFGGAPVATAVLRFTPARARWVRRETWHPAQKGYDEANGSYVLEVPYADDRELIGEILRHGPDVEVLGPWALRERVRGALQNTLNRYE